MIIQEKETINPEDIKRFRECFDPSAEIKKMNKSVYKYVLSDNQKFGALKHGFLNLLKGVQEDESEATIFDSIKEAELFKDRCRFPHVIRICIRYGA